MSRVDVIVPCYNYARFLRQCVESVLTQEGVDVRVLVIDDCSTDDSEAVGRQLAAADGRVEYRRHAVNKGHHATYNEGLEWASAEYMLLLSADDLVTPGALSRATQLMDAHGDVGLTYGRSIKTRNPGETPLELPDHYQSRVVPGREFIRSICATGQNMVPTATAVVRARLQKEVGGYRDQLPHTGDLDMWLRFALRSSVGYLDIVQAYYRLHGQNMSVYYNNIRDFRERRKTFDLVFQSSSGDLAQYAGLWRTALRSLAEDAYWTASKALDRGDSAGCEQFMAFALETYRPLQYRPAWWRLQIKRRMSKQARLALQRFGRKLRGRPLSASSHNHAETPVGPCW